MLKEKKTLIINGDIDTKQDISAIDISQGSDIEIRGDIKSSTIDSYNGTVYTHDNADNSVTVTGSVDNSGTAPAILNKGGTINVAGDVTGNTSSNLVCGDGTSNKYKSETIIGGAVKNTGNGTAIFASNGAKIIAGSAENTSNVVAGDGNATVQATMGSTVEVKSYVKNNGTYNAIRAMGGSTVTVGSATNDSGTEATVYTDNSVSATTTTTVVITDSVTNEGMGSAIITNSKSEVVVEGTVKNNSGSNATVVANGTSKVIVYKIENEGGGDLTACAGTAEILYLIRGNDDKADYSNMNISGNTGTYNDYKTAKAGTALTVTVDDGYTLDAGTYQYEVNGNTYTITVKEGGGVTLKAIKKAIEEAKSSGGGSSSSSWSSVPTTYGSASAPITGGKWSKNADGSFTYYNNGEQPLNNRVWIKYNGTDGKEYTGCFYFDKQGKMQTGWKQIDGEWYYFSEADGETKGMMQVNTTTPDGYKVDANGKWVK